MSASPKVERVNAEDVKRGAMIEKTEHPWMSRPVATRTATDHIRENPAYYGSSKNTSHPQNAGSVVILNQNVKAVPAHKRKRQPPKQQFNILTYGNELLRKNY